MVFKFIRFTKELNYEIQQFENNINYRVLIFRVKDFSDECDSMQILTFEHQPIIKMDRLAGIYRVPVFKQPGSNYLLARAVLMDNLFHYQYPFRFPDLFEGDLTKHE